MSKKKLTFEDSMKRIEEIVSHLEKGDIPLEESISLFEEGASLLKSCDAMLSQAEQKVLRLRKGMNGEPEELPFED